jgi:hypothetical protein
MNLRNNQITVGELLSNARAKAVLGRNFPQLMNPFLLTVARNMTLQNTLKLATGPCASEQVTQLIADLEAIRSPA